MRVLLKNSNGSLCIREVVSAYTHEGEYGLESDLWYKCRLRFLCKNENVIELNTYFQPERANRYIEDLLKNDYLDMSAFSYRYINKELGIRVIK